MNDGCKGVSDVIADRGILEKDCGLPIEERVDNIILEMKQWRFVYCALRGNIEKLLSEIDEDIQAGVRPDVAKHNCIVRITQLIRSEHVTDGEKNRQSSGNDAEARVAPRRFQCERCGGTGHEIWTDDPASHYMGQCRDCNGEGLLGEMPSRSGEVG